jgi:spoIIIJ-associated protein
MVVEEFEGRTEEEAIELAIQKLGLRREDIDVEIVESRRPGLFRSGNVRIRVQVGDDEGQLQEPMDEAGPPPRPVPPGPLTEIEQRTVEFLQGLLDRMGFDSSVRVFSREDGKIGLDVETEQSAILIGRQGNTLEAVQFVTNLAAARMGGGGLRVIVDTEDYRQRRQRNLIRSARKIAQQVRSSGQSQLLEAMNPYERRLVHTALGKMKDIATISEGDGLYKRIRVCYRDERLNAR